MSSEDYLTRYFQQLGKVLAALLGLREKKKYQLAIYEINQVLDTWFNLPVDKIENINDSDFKNEVIDTTNNDLEKIKAIAELLYQKTITYKEMEKTEEVSFVAKKALMLFKIYDEQSGTFSIDIQQRISELDGYISHKQ